MRNVRIDAALAKRLNELPKSLFTMVNDVVHILREGGARDLGVEWDTAIPDDAPAMVKQMLASRPTAKSYRAGIKVNSNDEYAVLLQWFEHGPTVGIFNIQYPVKVEATD